MPKITFIDHRGRVETVESQAGETIMQIAADKGVIGILGECGGACQCATCHVYVDPPWAECLPMCNEFEDAMLDGTVAERTAQSRLGCQLVMRDELHGLVIRLPERQV